MKLPLFRKPVRYVPVQQREGSLQDFRERILTILLASALTLGALAFIAAAFPAIRAHQYWAMGVFAVCYGWTLIITLQRQNFSYAVKIYSLVSIFYVLGLINLVQNGISTDAGVFLLSFVVVTSLMIGARSGVFAIILSVGTFALVGLIMSSGKLIPPIITNYHSPLDWISGGTVLILLSTFLTLALNTILKGLNDSISKVKILAVDTDREREQFRLRSQDLQRRLAQLRTAAEIEHSISAVLDQKTLMQKVVDSLGERFGLYYAGIFMLPEYISSLAQTRSDGEYTTSGMTTTSAQTGIEIIFRAGTSNVIPEGRRFPLNGLTNAGRAMSIRKPRAVDTTSKSNAITTTYLPLAHTELALPLISHDKVIGVLMIYSTQTNAFDVDDISLFQSSADSLAIAVENARLFQQNQDDLDEIRTLQKQYLRRAWADTERVQGNLSYTYDVAPEYRAIPESRVDPYQQVNHDRSTNPEDQDQTPTTEPAISTYSVPISIREQIIGQLTLEAERPALSAEDRAFIESIITEAALALDNARLLTETQRRADHDRLIADITRTVQASTDIETILVSSIRELGRKLQASEATISLYPVTDDEEKIQTGSTAETVDHRDVKLAETGEINSSQPTNDDPTQREVSA